MFSKILLSTLITVLFLLIGCTSEPITPGEPQKYFFSFENDMEGWKVDGTDLEIGDTTIDWSITRSQDMATDGNTSVKLYLNNRNDAGKIWIERQINLKPNSTYQVSVEYDFASSDYGDFNLFKIITGVLPTTPSTTQDIVSNRQGETGNNNGQQFVWLEKKYEFTVKSDEDGVLYVFIGVWGTWEGPRIYYLDSVNVSFIEK